MKISGGIFVIMLLALFSHSALAKDEFKYVDYCDSYLAAMQKMLGREPSAPEKTMVMQYDEKKAPASVKDFKAIKHIPPHSQGDTGSCWCFSATSFLESEIMRLNKKEIKLSEMYGVYWEYVEKAAQYIQKKGDSRFSKGSEPNCAIRVWKKYGIVPIDKYKGDAKSLPFYDHSVMFEEMNGFLKSLKEKEQWDEEKGIAEIKTILNKYLDEPPQSIEIEGKKITPSEYLKEVLKINLDDYIDVMSLIEKPIGEKGEYPVADNWWHSKDYLNVSLERFMEIIKKSARSGYGVCIVGDISESGYLPLKGIAVIPDYDIASKDITDFARQLRFTDETTTDDHAIHLVGYTEKDGKDWYLIKDSGAASYNNPNHQGYFFFHEDYVKLKMMNILVHKDMLGNK